MGVIKDAMQGLHRECSVAIVYGKEHLLIHTAEASGEGSVNGIHGPDVRDQGELWLRRRGESREKKKERDSVCDRCDVCDSVCDRFDVCDRCDVAGRREHIGCSQTALSSQLSPRVQC